MNHKFIPAKYFSLGWKQQPKLIVIHWVAGGFQSCINTFRDGLRKASAHFVVNTDGDIIQMVHLANRSWHAGESFTELFGKSANEYSIGIELVGPPSIIKTKGWEDKQIEAVQKLVNEIITVVPTIEYITDHSKISPGRKIDVRVGTGKPEDVFPWQKMMCGINLKEI